MQACAYVLIKNSENCFWLVAVYWGVFWLLDLNKSEMSQVPNSQASALPTSEPQAASQSSTPHSLQSIQSIKSAVISVPDKIVQGIDEGKGNDAFNAVLNFFANMITLLSSFCSTLALRQCLLTAKETKQITACCYAIGFSLAVVMLLTLLFEFNLGTIVLSIEFILAAFIIDIILRKQTCESEDDDIL